MNSNTDYTKKTRIKTLVLIILSLATIAAVIFASMRIYSAVTYDISEDRIEAFGKALEILQIDYTESEVQYEAIDAVNGRKFHIGNGTVELYLFDKNGKVYREIVENHSGHISAANNSEPVWSDNLVLYMNDIEDEETILRVLESI